MNGDAESSSSIAKVCLPAVYFTSHLCRYMFMDRFATNTDSLQRRGLLHNVFRRSILSRLQELPRPQEYLLRRSLFLSVLHESPHDIFTISLSLRASLQQQYVSRRSIEHRKRQMSIDATTQEPDPNARAATHTTMIVHPHIQHGPHATSPQPQPHTPDNQATQPHRPRPRKPFPQPTALPESLITRAR
jgi:hypothetical protein